MNKIKRLLSLLCILACVFTLTSCGSDNSGKSSIELTEDEEAALVDELQSSTEYLASLSESELKQQIETINYDAVKEGIQSFLTAIDESGEFVAFYKADDGDGIDYSVSIEDDVIYIKSKAEFKERDVKITYGFYYNESNQLDFKLIKYDAQYSMGETLTKAGLNTVMGISTVIVMLAFLSIVISLFKYINKVQNAIANKKSDKKAEVIEQITKKEESVEEEIVDDLEVIAVITAAIAASTQTSTDGFVVRSVRRVPRSQWKRS